MKPALLTFALFLFLAPAAADAAKPIMNMIGVPVPIKVDGPSYLDEELRAIIIAGCLARITEPRLFRLS